MRDHMHHMYERAVLAMGPGQALSDALAKLNIYTHRVQNFKALISEAEKLEDFSRDASIMPVIGSDLSLKDLWRRKHPEA